MSASPERIQALLDRQDILDCLNRFCRGIDRFDRDLFLSAFHADAIIAAGPFVGGPIVLYEWAQPLHETGQIATQHALLNFSCDLSGDTAHCETYYQFIGRNRDETIWMAGGRYLDRVERRDSAWKIAYRTNLIEWSGSLPALPLPFADVPDLEVNGAATRDRSDPSYWRPLVNRRPRTDA
ncbi:nuclear transport factor 2 family protein [Sphingomonas tabacisoli]|uniref:Nuclear transport factor 2 family protein n=1 Tax=Sphingomonas tabacisoli TaxID=2249466 RepID=A0ABW4I7R3_9SPHN